MYAAMARVCCNVTVTTRKAWAWFVKTELEERGFYKPRESFAYVTVTLQHKGHCIVHEDKSRLFNLFMTRSLQLRLYIHALNAVT